MAEVRRIVWYSGTMSRSKTPTEPIVLSDAQRAILEPLARQRHAPQHLVERARIILGMDAGERPSQITRLLGLHAKTVMKWRRRWAAAQPHLQAVAEADGMASEDLATVIERVLSDQPRSGAPPKFSAEQVAQIIAVACEEPRAAERPVTEWTPRELRDEVIQREIVIDISRRQVGRFLKSGRVAAASPALLAQSQPEGSAPVRPGGHPGV